MGSLIKDVRGKQSQIHKIRNPMFRNALPVSNLCEGLAFKNHLQPALRFADVPDKGSVDLGRSISKMQLQLDAASGTAHRPPAQSH
jgi:hypothetical protein